MLGKTLCLLLILQCVSVNGNNSVDKIIERIGDYLDTLDLNTDRDEYFWEDEYWYPPSNNMMVCPTGYGWKGNYTNGTCEQCPAGYYSSKYDFGLKSRCKPCGPGKWEAGKGQSECNNDCKYGTTFKTGSTSESDCIDDPDEMFGEGSFQSKVTVRINLAGDWSFLNDILMEVSGMNFYEARVRVDYNEKDDVSMLDVSAVLPNRVAVFAQGFLLTAKTYMQSVNDYAALADYYSKKIFDMLNNAETFKEFGWKMNRDQLKVKGVKIMNVDVKLNQRCEDGYRSDDWEGVGTKCVKDNKDAPSYKNSAFIQYTGESKDCMSLGGEARLRDFVYKKWPFPCIKESKCEARFTTSNSINSGKCAIIVYLIFYDEDAGIGDMESNLNAARKVEYQDGTSFEYSEDNSYKFRGSDCGADPKIGSDGSFSCSKSCDSDKGYRLTRSGNCQQCPYGTWFNKKDSSVFPRCRSCGYFNTTVFGFVPTKADECFLSRDYKLRNSDGVWGEMPPKIDIDLENNVNAEIEMNLCGVVAVKKRFEDFCSKKFSKQKMSLDDFTNYDVEKLGCTLMSEFSQIYEQSCKDFKLSWSDIMDDFEWGDVACFVAKGIYSIEKRGQNCENLSENDKKVSMKFKINEDFGNNFDDELASAIFLPMFSRAKKMKRFSFDAISNMMKGMFRKFGMYEMSKLTGLEMMDQVRDMIMAMPRGLSVKESEFEFNTKTKEDFFCKNGKIKQRCNSYTCQYEKNSEWNKCNNADYSEDKLQCDQDPCNECKLVYTFGGKPVKCNFKEEAKCDVPIKIDNGRLFQQRFGGVRGQVCDGCDRETTTYYYICNKGFRLDNLMMTIDGPTSTKTCRERQLYCKSTDKQINQKPNCKKDTCNYKNLENGNIKKIYAEKDSPCRYAEYQCNPGYEMKGESSVFCNADGTYSDMPRCVKAECQFSKKMENARFIREYMDDYYDGQGMYKLRREGWYQCINGTRDGDDVYNGISCGEQKSGCEQGNCPTVIENGYLMREWKQNDIYIGEYRCNDGFELRNAKTFSSSKQEEKEKYGWGSCGNDRDKKPGPDMMPRCMKSGSPEPCNMPKETLNGYKVEDIKNKEYGMVDQARYKCNNGYKMVKTWKGDIGWCRKDGTFELPYCMTPREYFEVEFKLVPGMSKMDNAGRVKARNVYADGSAGEWYAGCDDNFNGPAAGAICRSMGFRYGKQITADRKMKPLLDVPFGMTNIYCYQDDTLIMSSSCNAEEYGKMGWPLCVPEEQIAVQCFDETWKVDVGFNMVERSGKMSCPVKVMKEGNAMNMKKMDVRAKWGGYRKKGNGYEKEYFKEGVQYTAMGKFSKKKGFRAKFIGNKMDYDCFFCDVYMGDNIMNPYPDRNNNCFGPEILCTASHQCKMAIRRCYAECINRYKSQECKDCIGPQLYNDKKCHECIMCIPCDKK